MELPGFVNNGPSLLQLKLYFMLVQQPRRGSEVKNILKLQFSDVVGVAKLKFAAMNIFNV